MDNTLFLPDRTVDNGVFSYARIEALRLGRMWRSLRKALIDYRDGVLVKEIRGRRIDILSQLNESLRYFRRLLFYIEERYIDKEFVLKKAMEVHCKRVIEKLIQGWDKFIDYILGKYSLEEDSYLKVLVDSLEKTWFI